MKLDKKSAIYAHDFFMAALAWQLAWWARFNFEFPFYNWQLSLYILPLVLLLQGLVYHRFKLHRGLWRFASLPDLWNIIRASIIGALSITLVLFMGSRLEGIPRSIPILYPLFLMFLLGGPRLVYRMWKDHSFKLNTVTDGKRVLIIGAGKAGEMLVRDMRRDGQYLPVGFIDDDVEVQGSSIHGVKVLGKVIDIPEIASGRQADIIIIAVPSASNEDMQKILAFCEQTECSLRTLPPINDMVSGKVRITDLRDVSIEDLLGREKVELDWKIIQQGITNRKVLVTGGGGSIGTELSLQIASLNPKKLIVFERNEFNLYRIESQLAHRLPNVDRECILGDLCERDKVFHVMEQFQPDVIFHAAAYKHVPILQGQVREAVRNNILATKYLADAAIKYQCKKVVMISTDKAVNPANILGATKRVAEMVCEWKNRKLHTAFITVRFGNVLDSEGSVIPLFREQIRNGGPVTVTHPEITRFFMTIPEACQLIMQAGSMGQGGEIFVLDMGRPVKISYLAEQMIKLSGKEPGEDIQIRFTGLRPGEKLYEELFYETEDREKTKHPKIMNARHSTIDRDMLVAKLKELEKACDEFNDNQMRILLEHLVPSYHEDTITATQIQENVIPLNINQP